MASRDDLRWFATDVDTAGPSPIAKGPDLKTIGTTESLVALLTGGEQYLSGVFWGVPSSVASPRFRENAETEDGFEDLGDAVVEIRALDTTYIEIYAVDSRLLEPIAHEFGTPIGTE